MDSENPQSSPCATLKKIEEDKIKQIKETVQKLYIMWDDLGLELNRKSQRAVKVWEHVQELLGDIFLEEKNLYDDIRERVKNYSAKIIEVSKSLSITPKEFSGSLIQREEGLRQELDSLTKLRSQRIRAYQDLKSVELKHCQTLLLPEHQLPNVTGVPSEEDLKELEQNVTQLKIEKERRHAKFCRMKKELTTILEVTEIAPESLIEKDILFSNDNLCLSNETFKTLEDAISKAQMKKAELEILKKDLVDRLTVLWQRLKIGDNQRAKFLSEHSDCRLSTLKSMEQELERCEKIKRDNIKMFVESLNEELNQLWSKCFASEYQKRLFKFYSVPDRMDDEVLEEFDAEVDKWKKYYEEIKHILKKIDKRQELFELMIVFENKANDPNRFKNRKGNLLKEEKERKKLQKDLPALEKEIFHDISAYEEQKGEPFLYYGEDYRAFITNQWEERKTLKETEKLERQKQHYLQLQHEVTIGTPAKRPLMTTPKSAPSKLFKSNVGLSVPSTPMSNYSRRIVPHTVAKQPQCTPLANHSKTIISKTVGKLTKTVRNNSFRPKAIQMKDKVLRERNQVPLLKLAKMSPNGTTYTDFANELNTTARCSSQSSVLSTKKPGGTRISLNSSKRKSGSKSVRKSTRNTSKIASNLTPARGKFGLPFLI